MASLMSQVVGHEAQKFMLQSAIENQSLPHAMVFSGPAGIGKTKLAMAITQNLVCESPVNKQACGHCGACVRVEKNQSESLRLVAAQGAQIKIDQIRDILSYLSLASDGQKRVVIIDQANMMNAQASNSLLKTLEEPPPDVYFILTTTDVRLLMPTIRSRSQIISFKALSQDNLQQINPGLSSWMYKSARGQAGKLLDFSGGESLERRNSDLSFYEHFWTNKSFVLETEIKEFAKDRATAAGILKNWFTFTRDMIVLSQGARDQVLNSDQITTLIKLDFIPVEKLYDFSSALLQAIQDIDKVDMTLLFESLWVKHARI
ncbi:hypothetical protein CIK05_03905 [Bdellovibrio sp. qaytius]|nr:hypothetical protein CIK05_03905 [Bdellovibrio sp. qaytius]